VPQPTNPPASPRDVVERALQFVLDYDLNGYLELFALNGTVEFPFAPPGVPARMKGRDQIRSALLPLWQRAWEAGWRSIGYGPIVVHESLNPEVVVAEFDLYGEVASTGETFQLAYVHIYRIRNGQIVSLRDYWNPQVLDGLPESAISDGLLIGAP
jgi:ketosteroid isomerase-like protein